MRTHQAEFHVATTARVLGVSSSGFNAWLRRRRSARSLSADGLLRQVREIHQRSQGTYGAPSIHAELAESGVCVGHKRIARLMREAGLAGVSRRKGPPTTRRDSQARPAPDLVNRRFTADAPDRLWPADITYVPTAQGFLYLAIVLDAFSRPIVGWSMAGNLRTEPVLDALEMALSQRRPLGVAHPLRPRQPVHLPGLQPTLPRSRSAALDGQNRRLLRQRHGRELLRQPRMRTHRPHELPRPRTRQGGTLPLH